MTVDRLLHLAEKHHSFLLSGNAKAAESTLRDVLTAIDGTGIDVFIDFNAASGKTLSFAFPY